ncbi:ring finger domain protein [Puccinia sorghi]|uniref:Ring finger domain protein n=1 Tax=Puccinia sorghi TaxID=27349 RepID=A0A0L6V9F1_9BASI|nr:ring finger domain protein [Puccinia sorghi]
MRYPKAYTKTTSFLGSGIIISADRLRCSPLEDQTLAAIPENRPLVRFAFAPDTPAVRQHHASPSNEVQERRGWDSSSYQENIVSRSAVSTGEEAKEDAVIEMNRLHDEKTVSTEERDTTGEEASRCPICLEEYEDGEERSFWPECAHEFHRNCIDRHRLKPAGNEEYCQNIKVVFRHHFRPPSILFSIPHLCSIKKQPQMNESNPPLQQAAIQEINDHAQSYSGNCAITKCLIIQSANGSHSPSNSQATNLTHPRNSNEVEPNNQVVTVPAGSQGGTQKKTYERSQILVSRNLVIVLRSPKNYF